jgi:thiol:disulfide interchange protein
MPRFRQALGFPMMAAAAWLASVLAAQGGARALLALVEGLLAAALGAWVWGSWGGPERRARVRVAAAAAALALVAGGAAWAMAAGPGRGASGGGAGIVSPNASSAKAEDPFWRPWSEAELARLRGSGVPVFVDFTADWCLSCRVNEAAALDDSAVRARFAALGVVALKADWSSRDEAIGRALAALGRASVPVYALYAPGAREPELLPELLSPAIVLRYLDRARLQY